MRKLLTLLAGLVLSLQMTATSANAAPVNAPVDANEYISVGGQDWAWAAPCAAVQPSCGVIDLSYQGPLGWAVASAAQLDAVIGASGGLAAFIRLFQPGDVCASRFFSVAHAHCDYGNGLSGIIWNYSGSPDAQASYSETFVVRGDRQQPPPVPVPAAGFLLLGGLGLLAAAKRRK